MHGTMSGKRNTRAHSSSLPAVRISQTADNAPNCASKAISAQGRRLDTAFRSLATTVRCRTTIARSKLPTCVFDILPIHNVKAGVPSAPPLDAASITASGELTAGDPCLQFRISTSDFPGPPLPFRTLHPSRSTRSVQLTTGKPALRNRPDLLVLPGTFLSLAPFRIKASGPLPLPWLALARSPLSLCYAPCLASTLNG
jgi:hypothetical protein